MIIMNSSDFQFQNPNRRKGNWINDPHTSTTVKPISFTELDHIIDEIRSIVDSIEPQLIKVDFLHLEKKQKIYHNNIKLSKTDLDILLLFSVLSEKDNLIDILLKLGADPFNRFYRGWTCFHWCASQFKLHSLDVLMKYVSSWELTKCKDKHDISPFDVLYKELLNIKAYEIFLYDNEKMVNNEYIQDETPFLCRSKRLVSWGDGSNYVLGHGDTHSREKPKRIGSIEYSDFKCISTSFYSSAVVTSDNSLYIWGLFNSEQGVKSNYILTPQRVFTKHKIRRVSLSDNMGTLVTKEGVLYTLKADTEGKMNNEIKVTSPSSSDTKNLGFDIYNIMTQVKINLNNPTGNMSFKVKEVSCSNGHIALLTKTGQCWTFGNGQSGQLGHGSFNNESSPRIVTSLTNSNVIFLSTGLHHTLVGTDKNDIYVMGFNNAVPKRVSFRFGYPSLMGPERFKIAKISSGLSQYLVLTEQNDLFCFVNEVDKMPIRIYGNNFKESSILMEIETVECWEDENYVVTKDGRLYHFSNNERFSMKNIPLTQRLITIAPNKSHYLALCQTSYIDDRILNAIDLPIKGEYLKSLYYKDEYSNVDIILKDGTIKSQRALLSRLPYFEKCLSLNNHSIALPEFTCEMAHHLIYWLYTNELYLADKSKRYIKELRALFNQVGLESTFAAMVNSHQNVKKAEIVSLKSYLNSLVNNDLYADCTLLLDVEDDNQNENSQKEPIKFKAHKFILTKRSEWFSTLFSGRWSASLSNEVRIPKIKDSLFKDILIFCYTDELNESLNIFELIDIAILAEHLLIRDLSLLTSHRIVKLLKPDNISFVLEISETFKLEALEKLAYSFVFQNLELLMRLESLKSMEKHIYEKIQNVLYERKMNYNPVYIDRDMLSKFKKILYNWNNKFTSSVEKNEEKLVESNTFEREETNETIQEPIKVEEIPESPSQKSPWGVDKTTKKISLLEIQNEEIEQSNKSKLPSPRTISTARLSTSPRSIPAWVSTSPKLSKSPQSPNQVQITPKTRKPSPRWGNADKLNDEENYMSNIIASSPITIEKSNKTQTIQNGSPLSPWKSAFTHQYVPFAQIQEEQQTKEDKFTKSLTEIMNEEILLKEHRMVEEYYEQLKKKKEMEESEKAKKSQSRQNNYRKNYRGRPKRRY